HDDAAGDFIAVLLENAAAKLRAELNDGNIFDVHGRAVDLLDDGVLDVLGVLDPADATDEVLGIIFLDDAPADGHVAFGDGGVEIAERDAMSAQRFGADVD